MTTEPFRIEFAGCGSAKSGTTWLAHCLGEHPGICMATIKETNYFCRTHVMDSFPARRLYGGANHALGDAWFQEQFAHWVPGQIRGEYSNGYLSGGDAPALLHAHNPAIKLIFIFRNPVEVLYSGYYQIQRTHPFHEDFENTMRAYPAVVDYCRYAVHLQQFRDRFPGEQMLIIVYDDLKADAQATFANVCRYLGVDDTFKPASIGQRVNPRTVPRSRRIRDLRCAIRAACFNNRVTRALWVALMKSGVLTPVRALYRLNERPASVPPMDADTRTRLVERFRDDNQRLGDMLGRDLSHWSRLD